MDYEQFAHREYIYHLMFLMDFDNETDFDLGAYPTYQDFESMYASELEDMYELNFLQDY